MEKENKDNIIEINSLRYIVYEFNYIFDYHNGNEVFFLLDENFNIKGQKTGEVYIVIPTWLEIQDIYQSSSRYNIMTKEYDIDDDLYEFNKVQKLCFKIVENGEKTIYINGENVECLYPTLGEFVSDMADDAIGRFYTGTGLSSEESKKMSDDCYKYFRSIYKESLGGIYSVTPPQPAPVLLARMCEIFNCTPNVARRISKRDIDMIMISREQKDICQEPSAIGLGKAKDAWGG